MSKKRSKAKGLRGLEMAMDIGRRLKNRRYTVPELRRVTGMTARQVRHWADIGMLVPCFRDSKAKGSQPVSFYSVQDVVRALMIFELTRRGLSLTQVRRIEDFLEKKKIRLNDSARYLVTDGQTAYYAESATKVVDILKHQNQMILIPVWEHMAKLRETLKMVA